jgi:hypothetical protein
MLGVVLHPAMVGGHTLPGADGEGDECCCCGIKCFFYFRDLLRLLLLLLWGGGVDCLFSRFGQIIPCEAVPAAIREDQAFLLKIKIWTIFGAANRTIQTSAGMAVCGVTA